MKRILSILLCLTFLFSLCGCVFAKDLKDSTVNLVAKEKSFKHEDFNITLTSDFLTMDFVDESYDFIWGTEDITVMGLLVKLDDDILNGITAYDYAIAFCEEMQEPVQVKTLDGIPITEYEAENKGNTYKYLVSFYKSSSGIWVVMFGAEPDDYSKHYSELCKYAKSVSFDA